MAERDARAPGSTGGGSPLEIRQVELHGRRLVYRVGGEGPPLVLVHGITQDSTTWEEAAARLTPHATVIAPDLPGHGQSQNPEGDHSLGAYATTIRDLVFFLEIPSATVVGHSLGGGVALQFAYQFPDLLDRLVLVDSGGLGEDVSPILRAAALPGADLVLALLTTDAVTGAVRAVSGLFQRLGLQTGTDLREMGRGIKGLADPEHRRAFLRTVDAVIGLSGQDVSAQDKLYLASEVPLLIIWGIRDRIIPLRHAALAHQAVRNSWLHVIEDAGHFPHLDAPQEFADTLLEFVRETEPTEITREQWTEVVRERAGAASENGSRTARSARGTSR